MLNKFTSGIIKISLSLEGEIFLYNILYWEKLKNISPFKGLDPICEISKVDFIILVKNFYQFNIDFIPSLPIISPLECNQVYLSITYK
jgi:hypothetical protein